MINNTHYKSLISISDLSIRDVEHIYQLYKNISQDKSLLDGILIFIIFFENSTRTLVSFKTAISLLGAHVVDFNISNSSVKKGESVSDTIENMTAMNPSFIIVRHSESDFFQALPKRILSQSAFINAGCGKFEHPTQALIDYTVIKDYKNNIKGLNILICGDVLNSRVARSDIKLLSAFGANIFICGSNQNLQLPNICGYYNKIEDGLKNADVIIILRIQKERVLQTHISTQQYVNLYCLTAERLKLIKKDAIIMHPGPINRDIELDSTINDSRVIPLEQTKRSVFVRQALMKYLIGK